MLDPQNQGRVSSKALEHDERIEASADFRGQSSEVMWIISPGRSHTSPSHPSSIG